MFCGVGSKASELGEQKWYKFEISEVMQFLRLARSEVDKSQGLWQQHHKNVQKRKRAKLGNHGAK